MSNGRLVGTRTSDLYRVKAAWLCTSNNLEGVGDRLSTLNYGYDGIPVRRAYRELAQSFSVSPSDCLTLMAQTENIWK
jgi:hypothetical protein